MPTNVLDQDRLLKLPLETVPALIAQMAAAQSTLAARLLGAEKTQEFNDELLDAEGAAEKLGVSKDWLYTRTNTLPFVVRLGRKVKFSLRGIEKYIKDSIANES
ncbi:MAG: helix-turn-helix domain-containing protein [Acidobacteriia bacterium]|nr:helix-turn-helix domain-containing protein [Terriglobia bacterium]